MAPCEEKKEALQRLLATLCKEDTLLAFSGGVDSTLLLSLLKEEADRQGTRLVAATADTFLHPMQDAALSSRICEESGVEHVLFPLDELEEAGISGNPPERCYLCKRTIFSRLKEYAAARGIRTVIDGTNLDDTKVYRPGLKALEELGIVSPLKEAGFTKEEVRHLAEARGLSTARRPSTPCLATRFPYGTHLEKEALEKVEEGENFLRGLGLYNVRLRVHGDLARIETDPVDFPILLGEREKVVQTLHDLGYTQITLDLAGFRSGSFDEGQHGDLLHV